MKYLVKQDGYLYFECVDGGIGSEKPRRVNDSKGLSVLNILDAMWERGHLSYQLQYDGRNLNEKEWNDLLDDETMDPSKLAIYVTSSLDVITLCGFAYAVINGNAPRKAQRKLKYKRPSSKKQVANSWLYQNATDVQGETV